jgi:hypothetical protein
MQVSEFRNHEIAFFDYKRELMPFRGYQITDSQNLIVLKKILNIENKPYNTYVTIAKYSEIPRFPINPKKHWPEFKEWVKIRDETIKTIDFMLDFDSTPNIKGLKKAWEDVQLALTLLPELIGEQSKYLTVWFSGNKGFHILGKCKINTTAQDVINKQLKIAQQLKPLCKTLDITIYDTARLRKLLGSIVYSTNFGKTRVIPISNQQEFKELIQALKQQNFEYFKSKELIRLNNIILKDKGDLNA